MTAAFYLAWVVSGLSSSLDWLQHLSIFAAFGPQHALTTGSVDLPGGAVLLAIGLLSAIASLLVFEHRDVLG